MKKPLRNQWMKALRSGDYKQGRCCLYYKDRGGEVWCCLGVLRHIADPKDELSFEDDGLMLDTEQLNAFSLKDAEHKYLMAMNDGRTKSGETVIETQTFNQIADWIGENL